MDLEVLGQPLAHGVLVFFVKLNFCFAHVYTIAQVGDAVHIKKQ